LTIYSSMPLQGAGGPQSRSVVNGMKLALAENHDRAGKFKIKFVSLDNSTAQVGSWTPDATSANARKAAGSQYGGVSGGVQRRRGGGVDPDPRPGRGADDQPGEHRGGFDDEGSGGDSG
jgi:hypothetical protein